MGFKADLGEGAGRREDAGIPVPEAEQGDFPPLPGKDVRPKLAVKDVHHAQTGVRRSKQLTARGEALHLRLPFQQPPFLFFQVFPERQLFQGFFHPLLPPLLSGHFSS